jgi:hypothetical protein
MICSDDSSSTDPKQTPNPRPDPAGFPTTPSSRPNSTTIYNLFVYQSVAGMPRLHIR